jgi:SAM-dependent methyltransferase
MTDPAAGQRADVLMAAWAARVRANREQAERVREAPDGGDFYAPVSGLFVADPRRSDDPTLEALREIARPDETWLDIGAGAGRYALPLALRVREVIALDPSAGMLDALRDGLERHGIRNVRPIHARWPMDPAAGAAPRADVALIAHLGYDVEAIGAFLDAMEAAAGRLCVAVLAERAPSAPAGPFWPVVHREQRVELPALGEFLAILRARGRTPSVTLERRQPRAYPSHGALMAWLRNQLFVVTGSAADERLVAELGRRMVAAEDGSVQLVPEIESRVGVASWLPQT